MLLRFLSYTCLIYMLVFSHVSWSNWGGLGSTNVVEELNNVRIKINDNFVTKDLQIVETPLGNGLSSLKVRLSPSDPEAFSMMLLDDAIDLSSESIKQITANKLSLIEGAGQNGEQFFDVVVHGEGKDYFINGVEITSGDNLAQLLQTHNQSNQTVRLLSCSSLESAKEISNILGVDLIANNGLTRIHDDGGITAVSKNGTGNEDWYRLSPDGTQVKVNVPDPGSMPESFVTLGGVADGGDDLAGAWKTGWNKQKVLDLPKGSRPNPSTYLDQSYIDNHIAKFDQEGGAFIAVKSWVEGGNYTQFPVKKYVMLKSDMQNALSKYKQTGNINDIEDALGYARGDLAGLEDELFVFYPDKTKYNFELPNGNEIGANNLWEPGGKTSGGYREAVLIDNANPSTPISHNKSIESLKNQFSWEKL